MVFNSLPKISPPHLFIITYCMLKNVCQMCEPDVFIFLSSPAAFLRIGPSLQNKVVTVALLKEKNCPKKTPNSHRY